MKLVGFVRKAPITGALLALVNSVWPIPIKPLDLDDLASKAQLIVVGEVTSVREDGRTLVETSTAKVPARIMAGELRIDRVLKGPSGQQLLSFRFFLPEVFIGFRGIGLHSYQVFFFQNSGDTYEFVSPYYPSVITIRDAPTSGESPLVRVVNQVGAVLYSATSSEAQKQEATYVLRRSKSPAAVKVLRQALKVKERNVQLDAAAALLERNDISGLPLAEGALLDPPGSTPDHILHNLRFGIAEGVKDETAIPTLSKLLFAGIPETRRAAASALWHTHSSSAIHPLGEALDDSDFEVRYYAVVGLAEITGQSEWRPNMDDFLSDQQRYLQHWKDWARSR